MTDITSLGFPLVYKAAVYAPVSLGLDKPDDNVALRTAVRDSNQTKITVK